MSARREASNWGRWGPDDERGTLNLLTADAVLGGVAAIRSGKVYGLGLPINATAAPIVEGRGEPRRLTLTCDSDDERYEAYGAAVGVGANQDILVLASHHGTHLDALSHVFADRTMYNGFPSSTFKAFSGAGRPGVEKLGVFAGRAVLLDVAAAAGVECLPPGHVITRAELESCATAEGVDVREGDILLIRTGWLEQWQRSAGGVSGPGGAGQPGIGLDACSFIRDHDIAAVGADNSAVEAIPFDKDTFLSVHIELLVTLGVPLLEHLSLAELARDRRYEVLLCVAPLPVTGAGGSPVNPIAIA